MVIKMLMFDFKNSEKPFFKKNEMDDFDIKFFEQSLNEETLKKLTGEEKEETFVISVFITSQITKKILSEFKNLRIIATRSTGFNHIDIEACSLENIKVVNVENYGSTSVVQYTFGVMIALIRNLVPAVMNVKQLKLSFNSYTGRDLSKLTIGVIGCGAIGSGICKTADAFGMNILGYDLKFRQELINKYKVEYVDLEKLLKNSDIITMHVPYTSKNYHMIGKKEFQIMKDNAIIINTARGELIDTIELYNALESKKIAGAGLDVAECEQLTFHAQDFIEAIKDSSVKCKEKALVIQKMAEMENVIITPHIAYDTKEAAEKLLETTFFSIKEFLKGGHANQVN